METSCSCWRSVATHWWISLNKASAPPSSIIIMYINLKCPVSVYKLCYNLNHWDIYKTLTSFTFNKSYPRHQIFKSKENWWNSTWLPVNWLAMTLDLFNQIQSRRHSVFLPICVLALQTVNGLSQGKYCRVNEEILNCHLHFEFFIQIC